MLLGQHSHIAGTMKSLRSSCARGASCLAGWPARRGAIAAAAAAVLVSGTLAAAPQARADGGLDSNFFTASISSAGHLVLSENGTTLPINFLPPALGTRPAIAWGGPASAYLPDDYILAYVSDTGMLSIAGLNGNFNLNQPVMAHTSPSIALLAGANAGWEIAYQGPNGHLYTYISSLGTAQDTGQQMDPHSSPSITVDSSGKPLIAYESLADNLATYGEIDDWDISPMMPGTVPSLAVQQNGDYVIASQGANGDLYVTRPSIGSVDTGLGMDPRSSPTVTGVLGPNVSGWQVAFEANTDTLWTTGVYGTKDLQESMAPGVAPSIAGLELPNNCSNSGEKIPVSGMDISWASPHGTIASNGGGLVEMTMSISPQGDSSWIGGIVRNSTGLQQTVDLGSGFSETAVGLNSPLSLPCNTKDSGTITHPIVIPDLPDFSDL
jgi:hypothetical protein